MQFDRRTGPRARIVVVYSGRLFILVAAFVDFLWKSHLPSRSLLVICSIKLALLLFSTALGPGLVPGEKNGTSTLAPRTECSRRRPSRRSKPTRAAVVRPPAKPTGRRRLKR